MRCPTRYFCYLTLSSILGFTQAYIIDDQNTAIIQYTPSNFWFPNSPDSRVDHSKLYNSTYTHGLCRTTDGCVIKIPFTGTGIAVYQLLLSAVNATITLDGGSPQLYVRDNACELQANLGCYNSSVYNAQSLANGDHLLEITFQGYNGGFNLDYIDVNGTAISPSIRTSVSPSAGTSGSRNQVDVIAWGTVGALAVVLIFVLALIYLLRRPQRLHKEATSIPHRPTSGITPFPVHSQPTSPAFVTSPSAKRHVHASQSVSSPIISTPFTPQAPTLTYTPGSKGITMVPERAHAVWTPGMLNTISSGSGSTNGLGPAGQVSSFERLRYPTQSGPASVAVDEPSPVRGFSTKGAVKHASVDVPPNYNFGSR